MRHFPGIIALAVVVLVMLIAGKVLAQQDTAEVPQYRIISNFGVQQTPGFHPQPQPGNISLHLTVDANNLQQTPRPMVRTRTVYKGRLVPVVVHDTIRVASAPVVKYREMNAMEWNQKGNFITWLLIWIAVILMGLNLLLPWSWYGRDGHNG